MYTVLEFLNNNMNEEVLNYCADNIVIKREDTNEEYSKEEKKSIIQYFIYKLNEKSKSYKNKQRNMIVELLPYVSYYDGKKEKSLDLCCIYLDEYFEFLTNENSALNEDRYGASFSPMGIDIVELSNYYLSPYAIKTHEAKDIFLEIIFELTWFGFDEEQIGKNLEDFKESLDKGVKDVEENNTISWEDFKKEIGLEEPDEEEAKRIREESEKEIKENMKLMSEYRKNAYEFLKQSEEKVELFQ